MYKGSNLYKSASGPLNLTYEKDFKSHRPDGRHVSTLAAHMEMLRHLKPDLSCPEELTEERFQAWQEAVKVRCRELLCMPEPTPQPDPVLLHSVQRDGYRVEKWEFYPDELSAIPVLLLVPNEASAENPVPVVFCFPGSNQSKELFAGEPLIEGRAGNACKYPERNCMGKHYVQNGMAAAVFDPICIAETALDLDDEHQGWHSRTHLCFGLLQSGYNYVGYSVFQKLCFWNFLKDLPFIDKERLGVSGHSLGSEIAIYMAMVSDDVKAVVFNDFLSNAAVRYANHTEWENDERMLDLTSYFHILPGHFRQFGFEDLCAAVAPRYLALNEGGAEEYTNDVRRAFAAMDAEDHFLLTQYPVYTDPATRTHHEPMPKYGLGIQSYFDISYVNASDHSFRAAPSIALLKKCFGLE